MKTVVADYQYKIFCLRIIPVWGVPIYLTNHVRDVEMNGNIYKTDSGYDFTGYAAETSMSPGTLDLTGIAGVAGIDYDKVASGVFDNARVYAFATTWVAPMEDEEEVGVAILGKTTLADDKYTIEMMMLIDALNQSVGKTYTPACPKSFGGQEYAGCKVDLAAITVTGTITAVLSSSILQDSARTEPGDYFANGTLVFTSGPNAGLRPIEIKRHDAQKQFLITGITKVANAVVSVAAHTFVLGEKVTFAGVTGMTQINGLTGTVIAVATGTITVDINTTAFSAWAAPSTGTATVNQTITTHESFHYPITVGDSYSMIPGCRKRLQDCRDKWNNVVNFGGFSFVPTQSTYSAVGGN